MDKQEILDKIAKAQVELDEAKGLLDEYYKSNVEYWKPEKDRVYWYVSDDNCAHATVNSGSEPHNGRIKTYNNFYNREQAEQEAEKILVRRQLESIARRLNKGKKIGWKDKSQRKYFIYLDDEYDELNYGDNIWCKSQGTVFCLDRNFRDVAIQEIGEERLKKYLRGE